MFDHESAQPGFLGILIVTGGRGENGNFSTTSVCFGRCLAGPEQTQHEQTTPFDGTRSQVFGGINTGHRSVGKAAALPLEIPSAADRSCLSPEWPDRATNGRTLTYVAGLTCGSLMSLSHSVEALRPLPAPGVGMVPGSWR